VSALRLANRILSPGRRRGRLAIMIFHRVLPTADPLRPTEPDAAVFESRMRAVRRWFNVLPLEHAVEALAAGTLPPRALSITFDDGYADNCTVALPILRKLAIPATFFVATGYLDGGCMWNDVIIETIRRHRPARLDLSDLQLGQWRTGTLDERMQTIDGLIGRLKYEAPAARSEMAHRIAAITGADVPTDLMMTTAQLRSLHAAGMSIGAHTHSHPILACVGADEARHEIGESKRILERETAAPVRLFAYPNGKPIKDYTAAHVRAVRSAGFVAACSTAAGSATGTSDPFQLPRFTPWDQALWKYGARLSRNLCSNPAEVA
jgi:peptidoglycan/xylan/chitin deacetylase (PgdA/CDA1 family)